MFREQESLSNTGRDVPDNLQGLLAVRIWNGRCIVRLLSVPNEFSFVLIQLVPKLVTGFDHQFMEVMAKFRVKWHGDSLIPFSEARIAKATSAVGVKVPTGPKFIASISRIG